MSSCLFTTKRRKCGEVGTTWYANGHEISIWKNVFIIFNKLSCIGRFHMQFVKSTILSPNHKEVAFMFPCKCIHTLSQKDFAHSSWLMFAACYYMDIYGINFVISIFQVVLLFRITAREMVSVSDNLFCICMSCKNNSSWQGLWQLCDSECKRILLCSHNEQTSLLHVVGLLAKSVHLLTFRGFLEAFCSIMIQTYLHSQ